MNLCIDNKFVNENLRLVVCNRHKIQLIDPTLTLDTSTTRPSVPEIKSNPIWGSILLLDFFLVILKNLLNLQSICQFRANSNAFQLG